MNLEQEIDKTIKDVKACAVSVYKELGGGWNETIYQKAMEVALRQKGFPYETQRILPITYSGFVIGESIPDLVVWVNQDGKRVCVVIDLKWDNCIKEENSSQVLKYIQEMKKQIRPNESVYEKGYIINFTKDATGKKIDEECFESTEGVQILEVSQK